MLLRSPEDFLNDIGHSSDLELKKIGTERTPADQIVRGTCCRPDDGVSQRKRTSYIPRNKCVVPRIFEKHKKWKNIDTLQRRSSDSTVVISHNYFRHSAKYPRSSGLVWRTCWAGFRSFFIQYRETCGQDEWWIGIQSRTHCCVNLDKIHFWSMFQPSNTWCANTTKDSKTFQKTFEWEKLALTLFFVGKVLQNNIFLSIRDIELAGFGCAGSCREYTPSRGDEDPGREDGVEDTQKLAQWGSQDYELHGTCWNWSKDWFHAERWISILDCDQERYWPIRNWASRGERETHFEEVVPNAEKPGATKQQEQFIPSSSSFSTTVLPIGQQIWNDIPMENPSRSRRRWPEYYEIKAFIEKMMEQWNGDDCVIILTHQGGRIKCELTICRKEATRKWFQYCLDSNGFILHMRAVQGHSGGNKVDPSVLDTWKFRKIGLNTFNTLVLHIIAILLTNQDWLP